MIEHFCAGREKALARLPRSAHLTVHISTPGFYQHFTFEFGDTAYDIPAVLPKRDVRTAVLSHLPSLTEAFGLYAPLFFFCRCLIQD